MFNLLKQTILDEELHHKKKLFNDGIIKLGIL